MAISNFSKIVDMNKLQKLQDSFANATGLSAVVVDLNGKQLTKPSNQSDYCLNHIRQTNTGRRLCEKCDKEGNGVYTCHAGLTDFSIPIVINGETVAKVLGGQTVTKELSEDELKQIANKYDLDARSLIESYRKIPVNSSESVNDASDLFAQVVTMFISSEYYMNRNDNKLAILETEVKNVLEDTNAISTHTEELRHISKRQNILALNASIEAGRAGEAGKGFSVVADQMAVLSKQSSDIYSSITTFAKNIDSSIHKLDNFFNEDEEDEDLLI